MILTLKELENSIVAYLVLYLLKTIDYQRYCVTYVLTKYQL